jgi:ABC-type uncharacterized transport system auxiliary subunit
MRFLAPSAKPDARPRASASSVSSAALALAFCVLLANCGSARPVSYYRLEPMPASTPQSSTVYPVTIVVGHITAPLLYRDDRIVYSNGQVELGADYFHRWAEAPAEMLESMLLQDLRASGQFRSVQRLGSSSKGDYVLRGHLSAFNEVDTGGVAAQFAIEFELFQPKTGSVVWTFPYSHDEPANSKSMSDVVLALQSNVRTGLQQATSSLTQYFASHPAQ